MKPVPAGTSDWAQFSQDCYCVDKTLILQIDGKRYDTLLRAEGVADVVKIGLAYYKNNVRICK